ncbi:MAG: ribonuclease PH [Phycisphaerae bacterium SM23_30]|nr:MAG: ribonuclease PH [Phycisphaerae bacterium SM23_30]
MAKRGTTKKITKRRATQLRPIRIQRGFTDNAAGSVLFEMGRTRVLCTASFDNKLPQWRQESGLGWVTAEYSMLPASINPRKPRSRMGHTDGRGTEIQRVVGRALRAVVDFEKLGPNTIYLDCDVLQADGGTRTAAINGSYIALVDAVRYGIKQGFIRENPVTAQVAAVSAGIIKGKAVLDLDYERDRQAEVDMNVAMTDEGRFVEIQGTGEQNTFSAEQLEKMLKLARRGIKQILALQKKGMKI